MKTTERRAAQVSEPGQPENLLLERRAPHRTLIKYFSNLSIAYKINVFITLVVICLSLFGLFYFFSMSIILRSIEAKEKAFDIKRYFFQLEQELKIYMQTLDARHLKNIDESFLQLQKTVAWVNQSNERFGNLKNLNFTTIQEAKNSYQAFLLKFGELNDLTASNLQQIQSLTKQIENDIILEAQETEAQYFVVNTMKKYFSQTIDLGDLQIAREFLAAGGRIKDVLRDMKNNSIWSESAKSAETLPVLQKKMEETVKDLEDQADKFARLVDKYSGNSSDLLADLITMGRNAVKSFNHTVPALISSSAKIRELLKANQELFAKLPETEKKVSAATQQFYQYNQIYAQTVKQSAQFLMILIFILTIITLILFGFIMRRSILTPVKELQAKVKEMTEGTGDLTRALTISSQDEIGELGQYFNKFLEILRDLIKGVALNSHQTASKSKEVSESTQSISTGTRKVSAAIEEINSKGKQLMSLSGSNQQKLQDLSSHLGNVVQAQMKTTRDLEAVKLTANEGASAGQKTEEVISGIEKSMDASSEIVRNLMKKSVKITSVIDVIRGLAKRTNLLAINSAIEAARMGEEGSGFRIIADEIRKFSENTKTASDDIETILGEIGSVIQQSMDSINQNAKTIHSGIEMIQSTFSIFRDIEGKINVVTPKLQKVEAASQDQLRILKLVQTGITEESIYIEQSSKVTDEVSSNFKEIDESMQKITQVAEALLRNSEHVVESINKFKT